VSLAIAWVFAEINCACSCHVERSCAISAAACDRDVEILPSVSLTPVVMGSEPGTPRRRDGAIVRKISSTFRCGISLLPLQLVPQYQEGIYLLCFHFDAVRHPQPPPHKKLFEQSRDFTGYQRTRTLFRADLLT